MDDAFATPTDRDTTRGTVTLECRVLVMSYAHLRVREPAAQARLSASLAEAGQLGPIIVVRDAQGRVVLIDGYRRVHALQRLGRDTVVAIVLGLSEADALVYCHRQETSRRRSAVEDGWLLRELQEQGSSLHAIGQALGRSPSWVSRRIGLVRALPERVEETVRRGMVPPDGAMKSLVPLARANRIHCERLMAQLGATRITTRQLAHLYAAWRGGDSEQRERIVSAPLLFLRAAQVVGTEPKDEIGWLVRELGVAGAALAKVGESLRRATEVDAGAGHTRRVRRAWRPVAAAWDMLRTQVEEQDDAGPGHPGRDLATTG